MGSPLFSEVELKWEEHAESLRRRRGIKVKYRVEELN